MSELPRTLTGWFGEDHRHCDDLWAAVEAAADKGDAKAAALAFEAFDVAMRRHLAIEEEVLFPAFEQATGMTQAGPTFMMRHEHAQMRGILNQMRGAQTQGDTGALLDQGDTLLMLIQQHNAKEENMLYPMSERALGGEWGALLETIEERWDLK
jgi:hemerythrin-like domain-containing protein